MLIRALILALALCATPFSTWPAAAETAAVKTSPAEVLKLLGLGTLFEDFGRTIAASARQQGIPDERFLGAWEAAAPAAFSAPGLTEELADAIEGALTPDELNAIGAFFTTDFGLRVAELERSVQSASPEAQAGILAEGATLYANISERRSSQFEEMLVLASADVTAAMMKESIRGMVVAMLMSQGGDIQVPWPEVDAIVDQQLQGMESDLAQATRAVMAYTYDTLSDEEVEDYLVFLRSEAAVKFYGAFALSAGGIIQRTMVTLGEDMANRLQQLAV